MYQNGEINKIKNKRNKKVAQSDRYLSSQTIAKLALSYINVSVLERGAQSHRRSIRQSVCLKSRCLPRHPGSNSELG